MNEAIRQIALQAAQARDQSKWAIATGLYQQLVRLEPMTAAHWHNLALVSLGSADHERALGCADRALQLNRSLWQSRIVIAKSQIALGNIELAENQYQKTLEVDPGNGEALLGLADLLLNEFGDPLGAIKCVTPLLQQPGYANDAELTTLMASLYDRDFNASELVRRVCAYAESVLQMPLGLTPPLLKYKTNKRKKRVGLLSPQFSVSPVYFLTFAFFRDLAKTVDLVMFSRGVREDWATEQFRQISTDWHDLQNVDALNLATAIAAQDIDELYDLGGWMDPIGLRALSLKPASKQFKWVGGQSVTTGLKCFDGWIGDRWHCPDQFGDLYSEPLLNAAEDYVTYTPPPYLPKPAMRKSRDLAIFANPAKLSRAFLDALKVLPGNKCFIHRQYRHIRVQDRLKDVLGSKNVSFILPDSHEEALAALNRYATVIDTFPYSSGLTAREAIAMGTRVQVLQIGELFCERHTARYAL